MTAKLWWLIHKDLVSEWRARRVWPAMLLFGTTVVLVFGVQMDLLPEHKRQMIGGLLWLAVFFSGMFVLDRSFAAERQEGCWEGLLLYPVSPSTVYLAKLAVNLTALCALQCVLIPMFAALCGVPLLARPGAMIAVALLGNLGIASVGTLLSALAAAVRSGGSLLALLVLPAALPVVLAAAEATRLVAQGDIGPEWWHWVQLLGGFALVFIVAGVVLFDFLVED